MFQLFIAKIIAPRITVGFQSARTHTEYRRIPIIERDKVIKVAATLVDPVIVFVGVQLFPRHDGIVSKGLHLVQFLFPCQIVPYIMIKNLCLARVSRFLDEQGDGNRGTGAGTKNFAAFPAGQFAGCPLISPQIEDIDGGKFFF